jgi:hypothetical protein
MHRRLLLFGLFAVASALAGLVTLSSDAPVVSAQQTETVELFRGCNNVSLTWPNGTPTTMVSAAITPASNLISIWRFNNLQQTFQGFAPQFVQQSDLQTVNRIDAVFICMSGPGTLARPVLGASGASTTTAQLTASPTATSTVAQPRITFVNSTAPRGSTVQVAVQTVPNTTCTGTATAPNGQTVSLGQAPANASGVAVLYWQVPAQAPTGMAIIRVTCGSGSDQASVTIT